MHNSTILECGNGHIFSSTSCWKGMPNLIIIYSFCCGYCCFFYCKNSSKIHYCRNIGFFSMSCHFHIMVNIQLQNIYICKNHKFLLFLLLIQFYFQTRFFNHMYFLTVKELASHHFLWKYAVVNKRRKNKCNSEWITVLAKQMLTSLWAKKRKWTLFHSQVNTMACSLGKNPVFFWKSPQRSEWRLRRHCAIFMHQSQYPVYQWKSSLK